MTSLTLLRIIVAWGVLSLLASERVAEPPCIDDDCNDYAGAGAIPNIVYLTGTFEPKDLMLHNAKFLPNGTTFHWFNDPAMTSSVARISEKLRASGIVADAEHAFKSLRPMAFRVDLWRLMVLWDTGGIYMDAKVKLLKPLQSIFDMNGNLQVCGDGFASPAPWGGKLYWNGLMAAGVGSTAVAAAIERVVSNVMTRYYGDSLSEFGLLFITGPGALAQALWQSGFSIQSNCQWDKDYENRMFLHAGTDDRSLEHEDRSKLLATLDSAVHDMMKGGIYYSKFWKNSSIYCDEPGPSCDTDEASPLVWRWSGGVPNRIFTTGPYPDMPKDVATLWKANLDMTPNSTELKYFNNDQQRFSAREIGQRLVQAGVVEGAFEAWSALRPWALRSDLWRLMVLWDQGGIYADLKIRFLRPLSEWVNFTDDSGLTLVRSTNLPDAYYNAIMASAPRNALLSSIIKHVVSNIKARSYARRDAEDESYFHPPPNAGTEGASSAVLAVTGPIAIAKAFRQSRSFLLNSMHLHVPASMVFSGNATVVIAKTSSKALAVVDEKAHVSTRQGMGSYGHLWRLHELYCDEPGPPCD